ncbi:MAG: sulfatase-like hydrolase/transferase, partial [bacterium]|nr:sulfatase-like hydrolase/transferase [bacterium]
TPGSDAALPNNEKTSQPSSLNIPKFLFPVAILLTFIGAFFLLFWPGMQVSMKKDQLKDLNVILITLDTLRWDHVSAYNQGRADTPHMDRMAEEGVLFERCIAQTPLTLPSHTTILSGTYPLHHQVRDNGGFQVPQSLDFVSEVLQKEGFATSGFIAAYVLHSKWGINQGFDHYSDNFDLTKIKMVSLGSVQKGADVVLPEAQQWIQKNKDKRFFSWIHLYDPHIPYTPPSPFKERHPGDPYRGEVEYMDQELGKFFDYLEGEGLMDNTLIILASDHGEGLGDHEENTHGFFIYDSTVRVPFIIRAPFTFPTQRVKKTVELADIAPTILDALGIPVPESYQGVSLVKLMFGGDIEKNNAYTETYYPRLHFGWSELKAIYNNNMKYIEAPKQELFDLQKDSDEKDNLAIKKSYEAQKAEDRLARFIADQSANAKEPGEAQKLSKGDREKLAALGYINTQVDTAGKKDLPDPKGKVSVFNDLGEAKRMMTEKKIKKAIQILEKIIKDEPDFLDATFLLGNIYSKEGDLEGGLKLFYEVLEKKPDYNAVMVNIVNTLTKLRQFDKALVEVKRFIEVFPDDHSFFNELGNIYFLTKEYDNALEAFTTSVEKEKLNPYAHNYIGAVKIIKKEFEVAETHLLKTYKENPELKDVNFLLAQVEENRGMKQKAVDYYLTELKLRPNHFRACYNLGDLYRKMGKGDEAVKYYQKSLDIKAEFNIPYFMIAKYYIDRGVEIDKAEELCLRGIKVLPKDKYTAFGHFILADIYAHKKEQAKYRSHLEQANNLKRKLIKENKWEN